MARRGLVTGEEVVSERDRELKRGAASVLAGTNLDNSIQSVRVQRTLMQHTTGQRVVQRGRMKPSGLVTHAHEEREQCYSVKQELC